MFAFAELLDFQQHPQKATYFLLDIVLNFRSVYVSESGQWPPRRNPDMVITSGVGFSPIENFFEALIGMAAVHIERKRSWRRFLVSNCKNLVKRPEYIFLTIIVFSAQVMEVQEWRCQLLSCFIISGGTIFGGKFSLVSPGNKERDPFALESRSGRGRGCGSHAEECATQSTSSLMQLCLSTLRSKSSPGTSIYSINDSAITFGSERTSKTATFLFFETMAPHTVWLWSNCDGPVGYCRTDWLGTPYWDSMEPLLYQLAVFQKYILKFHSNLPTLFINSESKLSMLESNHKEHCLEVRDFNIAMIGINHFYFQYIFSDSHDVEFERRGELFSLRRKSATLNLEVLIEFSGCSF
ncbi:uncharacterized protein BDR25DRAFT_356640 [Lindgomyces ingoldianus]|uniref:Uncharacterized protein n=1 Tax=Lindgomyces ingoldianus TaxID=673940 RepID=A0ACB6QR76_9PLEO|nr:uncharacterized protein BDR25DRAFT_356640 [Lindgomyces ingoldianus]KAF2469406.1 hypothetical protein BDR25DRAFT_356640 [Lindgomyces ingoldianus]